MGEAKRRKERLGEAYWKGQPKIYNQKKVWSKNTEFSTKTEIPSLREAYIDPEVASMIEQSLEGMAIAMSQIKEAGLDANSTNQGDLAEAARLNFFTELEGLEKLQSDKEGTFGWGRLQIFKAASLCLVKDSLSTPEEVRILTEQIHEAGEKMYEIEGMKGLHDPLIWLFMPKSWHRTIDKAFNGIGEWLS